MQLPPGLVDSRSAMCHACRRRRHRDFRARTARSRERRGLMKALRRHLVDAQAGELRALGSMKRCGALPCDFVQGAAHFGRAGRPTRAVPRSRSGQKRLVEEAVVVLQDRCFFLVKVAPASLAGVRMHSAHSVCVQVVMLLQRSRQPHLEADIRAVGVPQPRDGGGVPIRLGGRPCAGSLRRHASGHPLRSRPPARASV